MANFSYAFAGSWKDGQGINLDVKCMTVSYDQTTHAYVIPHKEYEDFIGWIAGEWALNNEMQNDDEDDADYLDRIGVIVSEMNFS